MRARIGTVPHAPRASRAQAPKLTVVTAESTIPFAGLADRIDDRSAVVAIVGLGYVGLPLLLAVAREGFSVIGVDADQGKVRSLSRMHSHVADVSDEELAEIGRSRFTTDHADLGAADVVVIAVPTPLRDGTPDLSLVRTAAVQVAGALKEDQLVVLESTTYPGTTEEVIRPILEEGGLRAGRDFALAYSPERIDPGSAHTLRETPKIVAGIGSADTEVAVRFYSTFVTQVVRTSSPRAAEMAKLIENTFRQVNIALVNELATVAPALGVDIWEALEAAATKPFGYMPFWPGPGVGGHCIAIDPTYLSWKVEQRLGFGIGFIEHARSVNNRMPAYVAGRISEALNDRGKALKGARVLVLGLTYKAGVNDVRESPALNVLKRLLAAGAECTYHDPYVASVSLPTDSSDPDEEMHLLSESLHPECLKAADCVAILTAHPSVDYDAVISEARLVFDAVGVTSGRHARHLVRL